MTSKESHCRYAIGTSGDIGVKSSISSLHSLQLEYMHSVLIDGSQVTCLINP